MTVAEAIGRGTARLATAGVESARLESELLLAHVLGVARMRLVVAGGGGVAGAAAREFDRLVGERMGRRPLQHLVGSVSFCGLELRVNSDVLIPRPETELLAERAWEFLCKRARTGASGPVALDFGTGSGCLAVAMAANCPTAMVHAVDVSPAALVVARENAVRHGVGERVVFHLGDGLAALPAGLRFDLLVGNPPYIATAEIATLQPEVRDHDPRLALDGGADGLDFYRRLAADGPGWLAPEGRAMLEFGAGQGGALRGLFGRPPWICEEVAADYSGRERIIIAALARA